VGVDIKRARYAAWVLSAGIAGVSGVLYAHLILAFAPQQFFFDLTFLLLVMAIIGGSTVSGAVIGAAGITVLTEFLRRQEDGFSLGPIHVNAAFGLTTLVLGVAVLVTIIRRPNGVFGRWELDEWLGRGIRRLAARRALRGGNDNGDVGGPGQPEKPHSMAAQASTSHDPAPT
jgi:branched-chain amino acid transport system permease protein